MFLTHYLQSWGLEWGWAWAVSQIVSILLIQLPLLISVAFFILADRKIWAAVALRRGPNVVGPFGLLQTFADAFKFMFKEIIIPSGANKVIFI
ncbi:MAG: NADH-quinone oxidoreductase subunit H, partial [Rhizomicrobium sp.]